MVARAVLSFSPQKRRADFRTRSDLEVDEAPSIKLSLHIKRPLMVNRKKRSNGVELITFSSRTLM
jgi:hypothetical protein